MFDIPKSRTLKIRKDSILAAKKTKKTPIKPTIYRKLVDKIHEREEKVEFTAPNPYA